MTNFERFTELRQVAGTKYSLFTTALRKTKQIDWDKIEGELQVNCFKAKKEYDDACHAFETFRNKHLNANDEYVAN